MVVFERQKKTNSALPSVPPNPMENKYRAADHAFVYLHAPGLVAGLQIETQ